MHNEAREFNVVFFICDSFKQKKRFLFVIKMPIIIEMHVKYYIILIFAFLCKKIRILFSGALSMKFEPNYM